MTVVASNYAREENDFYQTEPWVTEAVLKLLSLKGRCVWEPAAGNHLIADVLQEHGCDVFTSDITTYDRQHDWVTDFLDRDRDFDPLATDIFTNPPYGKGNRTAVKFCEVALDTVPGFVVMVLTAKFDSGSTRAHLFRDNPRFMMKIVLTDRISWTLDGEVGTEDHAVYVWGPTGVDLRPAKVMYAGRPR